MAGILAVFLAAGCVTHKSAEPTQAPAQAGTAPGVAPRTIEGIQVTPGPDQLEVWIQGSGDLEYTSIKQPFPFAVSIYLPDTLMAEAFKLPSLSDSRVSSIKTGYADKDKTTVKVEILLNMDLPYQMKEEGDRLGVILLGKAGDLSQAPASAESTQGADAESPDLVIPPTRANLTGIEFDTQETGHSDIRIRTSHPVKYETRPAGENRLRLILFNTRIPAYHQRPLLTRYFNSAVERVEPKPAPGGSKDTQVDIIIREQVPFRVVQNLEGIQMAFEPSTVRPPEFGKARKEVVSGGTITRETLAPEIDQVSANPAAGLPESDRSGILDLGKGPYTGEKIKLDFYDTDIKNVFRILRSVSGLNFAIDRDVQGKVTLSLEEPVPWDQVMDLVLKMNGLGRKMEGNVVRIATAETLRDEQKMVQEAIAARQKSAEQKKALEPLVTEYIPINYSDAKADIEPHVAQILTPERGKISVDQRTNMIILTDTQKKIDQAQELIYRLDTVTPQIMIEARVVEVTKEFSRSLGVSWNLSNDPAITSGFINDYNVSVNAGNSVGVAGNFSFFRLFGSSVSALNAQLEAAEQQGDVRIVSSPRILTLDNRKAMIKQGQEYAYLERDDAGGSSVKFKDVDLKLEVTPHVTPDKRIAMTVLLTKNDVSSLTTTGVPILATNEATTELLVNNNDTIVIGGVVKTTKREDDDGIPFLTGIPGLGYLFSNKKKEDTRNELLIFLTPSIVQLEQKRHASSKP